MDPKPRPSPHSSTRPWIHPFSASAALSPPQCPTQLWSSFPNAAHRSLLSPLSALYTPSHFSPAVFLQECPLFPHPLVYIHIPECCTAWTPERGLMHFQFSSQGYFALHVKCTHWFCQVRDSRPATPTASAGPSACTLRREKLGISLWAGSSLHTVSLSPPACTSHLAQRRD